MLLLMLCKISFDFGCFPVEIKKICCTSEHLQRKEQFLIDATDAGGYTEDQDCFPHPDVDRFQGAAEPRRRTRKQEASQTKNPL